jgi:aspartokinase/homoserine dehydrogenase 2
LISPATVSTSSAPISWRAGSSDKYRQIHDAFEKTGRHWLYNATVGAGLPVNHTVRDLIESGDSILALSGIFSGTLSWLFLQFDGTVPFTDLVDQAWQQGLTEPDPRVDLSGKDVMRKLVILAREAGYDIEPDAVRVESLVPAGCEEGSVDHFFENGEELNEQMVQRLEAANEMGWCCAMWRVLRPTVKRAWCRGGAS